MPVTIVIADDHGALRAGMRMLLHTDSDFCVVGEAEDGPTALRLVEALHPDVLVADVSMPPPNGLELAEILAGLSSPARVLIVTIYDDFCLVKEAKRAGAAGYITKRTLEAELNLAVREVASGRSYWRLPGSAELPCHHQNHAALQGLDEADYYLLHLIVQGRTRAQIATELGQTLDAVEQARQALMSKLDLRSRAALVHFAQDHNLT